MPVFIALLRAVNVGGTAKLSMPALKSACEAAGLQRVSTYIASGNLVFASDRSAAAVGALIAKVLRDGFSLTRNHPIIRRPRELARVISRNPFGDAAAARPALLLVYFLDGPPDAGAVDTLARHSGPERLHLDGHHLYVDYAVSVGRSKLTPAFLGKALKVPATGRNWNTTRKLLAMARTLEA